jgi:hypothetical protein
MAVTGVSLWRANVSESTKVLLCYQGKYVAETVLSTSSAVWLVASAPVSAEARVAKPQTFKSFLFR